MPNEFSDMFGFANEEEDEDLLAAPESVIPDTPVQESAPSINRVQEEKVYSSDHEEWLDRFGVAEPEVAPEPITPEGEDPTWQDYGRMVMSGGARIGEGMGWLLEKVGAEDIGGAVRQRSKESADAWINDKLDAVGLDQEGLSDTAVQAMQTEFLGDGAGTDKWNKAKLTAASSLLGTLAGMGVGGLIGKGLVAATGVQSGTKGARILTGIGYGAGEAGVAAPSTGAATEDEVLAMKHPELMESPDYIAVYESLDKLPEAERQEKAKELIAKAAGGDAAAMTAVSTFVLSAPFTGLMGKLTKNVPAPGGRIAGGVKGALEEGTQEFLQSGAEAISQNIAMRRADPTRDLTEGALEEAVGGALAGGLMGGPLGVAAPGGDAAPTEPPGPLDELEKLQAEREINSQKFRDGQAMREHQDQVRESVAARGGDALEQEVAAAEAGAALGDELSSNVANMSRLLAQRQAADEEAAYVDEQVKEDEARAKIQSEASERYEEGIKQVERDKQTAADKETMAAGVESRRVAIKETAVAEETRQAEAKSEAAAKTLASEKADQKLNKLRKRRQALGLDPKGDVEGVSPYPSAQEVEAFKGKKQKSGAMAEAFTAAANEAATSPTNDLAPPTKNQLAQGNYKKGHPRVQGLGITIESPAGSTRTAVDGSWSQEMKDDYGYIKGTESAEGKTEQLDVFVGKDHESDSVFVIDQVNKEGAFDEHKVMMSYPNAAAARKAYLRNYPKGFKLGPVSTLSVAEFKEWLKNGDQTVPYSGKKLAGTPKATSATTEQAEEVIQDERARKGRRRSRILFRQGDKSTSDTLAKELTRPEKEGGGGYSVDENTGERVTEGYSVGQGLEEIIEGHATPEQIEAFRRKYAKELKKKGNTLGGWFDETNNKTYLDVSVNVKDRAQAVALGKKNSERAIQDLKKGAEGTIRLDQEKSTRLRVDEEIEAAPAPEGAPESFKTQSMSVASLEDVPGDPQRKSAQEMVDFTKKIMSGEIKPNIIVKVKDGKPVRIVEGNHTLRVLRAIGQEDVDVKVQEVALDEGKNFKDFFSAITKGLAGKSSTGKAYTPVIAIEPTETLGRFSTEYAKYRGNFDDHIAFSIPGFKEVQILVGSALAQVYGKGAKILDIGASEGSFAKAITAVSGAETVALDPNPDMRDTFNKTPVEGSEYAMEALGSQEQEGQQAWKEDDGTLIEYFDPKGQKFDVVHEAMVFQFISPDRQAQISRVKRLLKANGVAIFEEKMFTEQQDSNEAKKNAYKRQYFEQAEMTKKAAEVLEGMDENTVHQHALEETLTANFDNVIEFWDSGNFKGYVVSDSAMAANRVVSAIGNTNTEFSTFGTPRKVEAPSTLRLRKDEAKVDNKKAKVDKAEADVAIAELNDKLPGMKVNALENAYQLPGALLDRAAEDFGAAVFSAKGLFDEDTGTIYVFSDKHKSVDDLLSTAMHEGVGHKGLRVLFSEPQMNAVLDSVYAGANKLAISRIANKYGLDLNKAEDQRSAADEFIAETAEKNIDASVLKRVIDAVRQVLRDLGMLENWTDSDIKSLLRRNRSALKRGKSLKYIAISRGTLDQATAEKAVSSISAKMKATNVSVIENPQEAPKKIRKAIQREGALGTRAAYDPASDTLYVFSKNHRGAADIQKTVLFEGVSREGLGLALGNRAEAILGDVAKTANQGALERVARESELNLKDSADELIAAEGYLASKAATVVRSKELDRHIKTVKTELSRLNLAREWSNEEIRELIGSSRKNAVQEDLSQVSIFTEAEIEETGELISLEERADVAIRRAQKRIDVLTKLEGCLG